jgi:hypothetical protein
MAAAKTGRIEPWLLLEAGAAVNDADAISSRRHYAGGGEGHASVVQALLDAKADPNRRHVTGLEERKHADHATGGFTASCCRAQRARGRAKALVKGGADPKATNGDGATATMWPSSTIGSIWPAR